MKLGWSSEYMISKNSPSYSSKDEVDSISDMRHQIDRLTWALVRWTMLTQVGDLEECNSNVVLLMLHCCCFCCYCFCCCCFCCWFCCYSVVASIAANSVASTSAVAASVAIQRRYERGRVGVACWTSKEEGFWLIFKRGGKERKIEKKIERRRHRERKPLIFSNFHYPPNKIHVSTYRLPLQYQFTTTHYKLQLPIKLPTTSYNYS